MRKKSPEFVYYCSMLMRRKGGGLSFLERIKAGRELKRRKKRIQAHNRRIERIRQGLIVAIKENQSGQMHKS